MQKKHLLKTILQIYSIILGIIGISFLFVAIFLAVFAIREKQYLFLLFEIFILSISGMLIFIAYQAIFRFSKRVIIELSTFTGLGIFFELSRLLDKYFPFAKSPDFVKSPDREVYRFLIIIGPLTVGYLVYKIMRIITLRIATKNKII